MKRNVKSNPLFSFCKCNCPEENKLSYVVSICEIIIAT